MHHDCLKRFLFWKSTFLISYNAEMLTSMVCPWFALICSLFVTGSSLRANLFLSFSSTTFLTSFSEYLLNCHNFNSSSTKTNPVGINIKLILTNIFYNRWVNQSFPDQKNNNNSFLSRISIHFKTDGWWKKRKITVLIHIMNC